MNDPKVRLGVDIGGTFTDVVLENHGELTSVKVLTTNDAPERAILDGINQVCSDANVAASEISSIIHGTTLATNALIERSGAKTALITTKGFRDVIEMRTESRFEQYDLNLKLPDALIDREHRYVLDERIGASGQVLKQLDAAEIETLAKTIKAGGYESLAVGLIHSYLNPAHEIMVRDIFAKALPELTISLSSEVSPQMREYERFNTVCANAYVKPRMRAYLSRLTEQLAGIGASAPVFLMHSGGGIISLESASEFPVRLVESGPAGGAIFAAHVAARYGLDKVLSFDMGGTTAKICLIKEQNPKTARVFEVARTYRFKKGSGMPISIPVIEMVEIGAGGGSLASVDAMRQIRVGPESAGSEPGPACYQTGGTRPAVTDSDLVLGRLDPDNFAGGTIKLSTAQSEQALDAHVGEPLQLDTTTAAFGLSEVVDENMANAARVHAVESGEDLSGYVMIAFGGAAPLHAGRLCEKLGIQRMLVPPGAGVGSAIGFLRAPFSFEATRSVYTRLTDFSGPQVKQALGELKQEASEFVLSCDPDAPVSFEFRAYMRYVGQGWEIPVDLSQVEADEPSAGDYQARFEQAYENLFGRIVDGLDIEITSWAVKGSTDVPEPSKVEPAPETGRAKASGTRQLFDPASGRFIEAQTVERSTIEAGQAIAGPAMITERETSIIVPDGFSASMQSDGCLLVTRNANASVAETLKPGALSMTNDALSSVSNQVMWNRLISVVEEQAQTLVRTAFSTSVREAGDLSAGVYDLKGQMLAQAVTGTPGHVNAMAESVSHFIREIGTENMFEGDVYITNDPWMGTGHLHDITVVSPSFHNGIMVGYFACTAHVVDIGGRGFGADANSVYEEGLCIPIMKFAERGVVDKGLVKIVRNNVREADQVVGDIYALAACNEIGDRRLGEMLDEFDLENLESIAEFILENSYRATVERIAALPQQSVTNEMTIDGYSDPIRLCVRLDIEKDHIRADFSGTSGIDKKAINVPHVYTMAYACYALKCAIAPEIPNNAASLSPFKISAPEGSILNAEHPAPVALRHVIGHMIPDTVLGALHDILPDTVPAEGAGSLCNFQLSIRPQSGGNAPPDARRAEVLMFNCGGSGARPTLDGMNATAFPSGVMTMPIEATEHTGPVIIWRKELRPDSGGAGKFRGGLGQYMEIGTTEGHEFEFSAMFDRVKHPARGRNGGLPGGATRFELDDGTVMRGKGKQSIPAGRKAFLALPGGAGYGDPKERDQAQIERDVAGGYISAEAALRDYGYKAN